MVEDFFVQYGIPLAIKISQEGEVLDFGKKTGEYKGIEFALSANGGIKMSFSPHKLYNELNGVVNRVGKAMNHDRFTPDKLIDVFDWLTDNFALGLDNCYLHQIEFGVNLPDLGIETSKILDYIISYKGKRSKEMETKGLGRGEKFVFGKYCVIKIYDKALQNGLFGSILRFEFKAKKIQPVEPIFGKHPVLSDLLLPHIWLQCGKKLLSTLDLCIFNDDFDNGLTVAQRAKLAQWRNPKVWEAMKADKRCKQKKAFEKFIGAYGKLHIKQTLKAAIENEVREMLDGYV